MFAPSRLALSVALHRTLPALLIGATTSPCRLHTASPRLASGPGGKLRRWTPASAAHRRAAPDATAAAEEEESDSSSPVVVRDELFVSNARKALDSLLSSSAAAATFAQDEDGSVAASTREELGEGLTSTFAERGEKTRSSRGKSIRDRGERDATDEKARKAQLGSLKTDFDELGADKEAPYAYADQDVSPTEAAALSSNGEEEFRFFAEVAKHQGNPSDGAINSDIDAADAMNVDEATVVSSAPKAVRTYRTKFGSDTFASVSERAYTAVNLSGTPYVGELAALLQREATAKSYKSPIWATKDSFATHFIPIDAIEDANAEGVDVTTLQRPCTLFNLQQTSLSPKLAQSADPEKVLKWVWARQRAARGQDRPKNILGQFMTSRIIETLRTHPFFTELQTTCTLWITADEVRQIGAQLNQGEERNFAAVHLDADYAKFRRAWVQSRPQERMELEALSSSVGVDLLETIVYYNVAQLADRHRFYASSFTSEPSAADKGADDGDAVGKYETRFFRCVSLDTRSYSKSMTFLMREYCRRNHFPTTGVQLWVPERALRENGGRFLDTARTPKDAAPALSHRLDGSFALSTETEGTALLDLSDAAEEQRALGAGVVPHPFMILSGGEVRTYFNADQTDIKDLLWERYTEAVSMKADYYREGARHRNGCSSKGDDERTAREDGALHVHGA